MNILILAHSFPKSEADSTAAFMKHFSDGLVEAGHKVIVLIPFTKGLSWKKPKFEIKTYKYIWPNSLHLMGYSRSMTADVKMKKISYLLIPFMTIGGVQALLRIIKTESIDLINVHWVLPNGLFALIVSKLSGVGYVLTLPGTDILTAKKNKLFEGIARTVANNALAITSNSSRLLKVFMGIGGINEKIPTEVISYPTDVFHLKPSSRGISKLRKKLGLRKNDLVLLVVGRLVYKKGYRYLIKGLPEMLKKKRNVKLVIVGDGDLKGQLYSEAKELNVDKSVIFVGTISRNEIPIYYNMSDVLVAPSIVDREGNSDGGPVVTLESMACAKPQILTNILGMSHYVEDGVGGYVVCQKNSSALADAVLKLAYSKSLREKMGKVNRRTAVDKLSTRGIGKTYTKLFEKIV